MDVIIFDYDGVIIDSFDVFMKYFIKACKKEGFKNISTEKDFLELYEKNMYESMYSMGMTKENILNIVYYMRDKLIENQNKLNLFNGMKKVLEKISKENIITIVTSNDTKVVKRFLKSHYIDFFNDIIGSDKEPSKIAKIKKIKSDFKGDNYYYVGDTVGDILEGKKANVKTIAVSWGWHNKEKLESASPDFLVDEPEELLSIIKK